MVGPDKCQRRGRLGRRNPHSDSEEQPKCAALPPQRGPGDLRLTRQGKRHRFSGEDEAQNGNSGLRVQEPRRCSAFYAGPPAHMWEKFNLYWFEELLPAEDILVHAKVKAHTSIPIALGESLFTRQQFKPAVLFSNYRATLILSRRVPEKSPWKQRMGLNERQERRSASLDPAGACFHAAKSFCFGGLR